MLTVSFFFIWTIIFSYRQSLILVWFVFEFKVLFWSQVLKNWRERLKRDFQSLEVLGIYWLFQREVICLIDIISYPLHCVRSWTTFIYALNNWITSGTYTNKCYTVQKWRMCWASVNLKKNTMIREKRFFLIKLNTIITINIILFQYIYIYK